MEKCGLLVNDQKQKQQPKSTKTRLITNGAFAIMQKLGGEHLRLCRLVGGQRVTIEKLNFDPRDVFGKPFGMFEVEFGGKNVKQVSGPSKITTNSENPDLNADAITKIVENGGIDGTAEQLHQDTQRQLLTAEGIAALKNTGVDTHYLVNKLVEGNSNFKERSDFSKQKYVRKKTHKHSVRLIISRPSIRLLCQVYYQKDPERLSNLRLDLLGLFLQLSAVHSGGCKVLVFEQALGLLGAAFLERLAGQGSCLFLHKGEWPQSIPCVDAMDFDEKQRSAFLPLRIRTFLRGKALSSAEGGGGEAGAEDGEEEEEEGAPPNKKAKSGIDEDSGQVPWKRSRRLQGERRALELVGEGRLDAICLATRTVDPLEVLKRAFPALRLSGSLVLFSPVREHLLGVWQWLRSTSLAVDVQLSQHFSRAHQVLPSRTHPLMQQPVSGGFLLHAIKVSPPQPEQQQQRGAARAALLANAGNQQKNGKMAE